MRLLDFADDYDAAFLLDNFYAEDKQWLDQYAEVHPQDRVDEDYNGGDEEYNITR